MAQEQQQAMHMAIERSSANVVNLFDGLQDTEELRCTVRDLFSMLTDVEVVSVKGTAERFKASVTTNSLKTSDDVENLVNRYFLNNKET